MTLTPAVSEFPFVAIAIVLAVLVVVAAMVWMYRHHSTTVADLGHKALDLLHKQGDTVAEQSKVPPAQTTTPKKGGYL